MDIQLPIKQTGSVCQTEFLFQWLHYLELIESLRLTDKIPKNFIVSYNEILEKSELPPIIYPEPGRIYPKRSGRCHRYLGTVLSKVGSRRETTPDSYNLLRLMNVLDIRDTKELTRFLEVEDV